MADRVVLWTAQTMPVLDELERTGTALVKRSYVAEKYGGTGWSFEIAYRFLRAELARRVSPPTGAESPFWLYADPQWVEVPSGGALLRVEVPADVVLLFDQRDWNAVLNLRYLPQTDQDEEDFQQELIRQGVTNSLDLFRTAFYPTLRRTVEQSWKRLLTPAELSPVYTQAALWELRQGWVTRV